MQQFVHKLFSLISRQMIPIHSALRADATQLSFPKTQPFIPAGYHA